LKSTAPVPEAFWVVGSSAGADIPSARVFSTQSSAFRHRLSNEPDDHASDDNEDGEPDERESQSNQIGHVSAPPRSPSRTQSTSDDACVATGPETKPELGQ
jgi:hypothetical protein